MFKVDSKKCVGCGACIGVCPVSAISMAGDKAKIDGKKCVDCGRCAQVCPQGAISPDVSSQSFPQNQPPIFPPLGFGIPGRPLGRGKGRGMGRGLGRGRGRGGSGRRWR